MAYQENANLNIKPPIMEMIIAGDIREQLLLDADMKLEQTVQMCKESELASKSVKKNENTDHNVLTDPTKITNNESSKFCQTLKQGQIDDKNPASNNESSPTLLAINDNCLLNIYQYLDIMDVVNLSITCKGLCNFATAFYFPKKAKKLIIQMNAKDVNLEYNNGNAIKLTLKNLETGFRYFGEFVDDLSFVFDEDLSFSTEIVKVGLCHSIVLVHCQNLRKLSFFHCDFTLVETYALYKYVEKQEALKELNLRHCSGITNVWPTTTLNRISKVTKLYLATNDEIVVHFFEYFRNVSHLTIHFTDSFDIDFEVIFSLIGHCLEDLEIIDYYVGIRKENIANLITDKLPKLKCLRFEGDDSKEMRRIIELPQFQILKIGCHFQSINSIMSALSSTGIIEMLIWGGFLNEDMNVPFLYYNHLQRLNVFLDDKRKYSNLLKVLTRSEMPVIHSFAAGVIQHEDFNDFLNFVDSKKTLETIYLSLDHLTVYIRIQFFFKMVEILKKPSMPRRPILKLTICGDEIIPEESIELLNVNQHVIEVKSESLKFLEEKFLYSALFHFSHIS